MVCILNQTLGASGEWNRCKIDPPVLNIHQSDGELSVLLYSLYMIKRIQNIQKFRASIR